MIDTAAPMATATKLSELGIEDFDIVTKLSVDLQEVDTIGELTDAVEAILNELNIEKIYALLIHNVDSLKGIDGMQVWQATQDLKHAGLIENVGPYLFSKDLEPFGHDMIADIIQAPFNIFDQRILKSGWLDVLHNCGTKFMHVSIFTVFFFKTSIAA